MVRCLPAVVPTYRDSGKEGQESKGKAVRIMMQCDAKNAIHITATELETREQAIVFAAQVLVEADIVWPLDLGNLTNKPKKKPSLPLPLAGPQ